MPRKSSVLPPSEGEFVRGNILDHLDKLEPSKGGKYICPVCGGNDLSISKEGATTCFNSGCEWKAIMDIVAPLDRPSSGNGAAAPRKKTKKELNNQAIGDEVAIEVKTDELAYAASFGNIEEARAANELATWCKANGHDKFATSRLLASKIKALKAARAENGDYTDDEEKPRLLREYETIKKKFGDRLSYNELKKEIELDGVKFEPVLAKTVFTIHHKTHLKAAKDDIADLVTLIAKENGYNPVTLYLDRVASEYGAEDTTVLDNLAKRYLGAERKIHEVALMRFLISAVARAYKPGCKVDTAVVLQGTEGFLKSTFFNVLASDEWFDDPSGNTGDKDEKMKFHRSWIVEWAELENVFKKKDISQVKAMLSAKIDILRPPYGRVFEAMKRPSVFCATTNQTEFLAGSTGNRRFWVIPVTKKIDADQLRRERDRIWAAAVALYRMNIPWWLTDDEEAAMRDQRSHFESSDTWQDEILDYLEGKEITSISKILEVCFDIPKPSQDGRCQNRVKGILFKNGWESLPNPVSLEGKKVRCWKKSNV